MIFLLTTLSSIVKSISIMTLMAVVMGMLERRMPPGPVRSLLNAALFSSMAIVAMATPVVLSLGLIIDIRMAIAGLGAALGGPVTAILVSVIAGGYRYFVVGGLGAIPGAAGIVTASICGLVWGRMFDDGRDLNLRHFAACGLMISISIPVGLALLPPEGRTVAMPIMPLLVGANVAAAMMLGKLLQRERWLIAQERKLMAEADLDALTGLANRRRLDRYVQGIGEGRKTQRCAVVVFDLDHFKRINDTWGHHVGDAVLVVFAKVLRRNVRPDDLVARLGGEEFLIVMPGMETSNAVKRAERILSEVRRMSVKEDNAEIVFRASAGVTSFRAGWEDFRKAHMEADRLLYEAKTNGRDRVVSALSHSVEAAQAPYQLGLAGRTGS